MSVYPRALLRPISEGKPVKEAPEIWLLGMLFFLAEKRPS
jgi:hypothetical protein